MADFQGFIGPAYEARTRYQDSQVCINLYPEIDPTQGAKEAVVLLGTPGLLPYLDLPTNAGVTARPVRLLYTPPSRPDLGIAAIGPKLVAFTPNGAGFIYSTFDLISNVGPMRATDNGTDIVISDGPNGYSLNIETLAFAKITDAAYYGGNPVFLDSYIILNKPDTPQFYWSDISSLVWDGLNFATKEAWPDNLVAVWSEHRELWLLGQQTSEVWYNSGDTATFTRNSGAFMQHGCAAPYSLSRLGETFAFVATDERGSAIVVMASGYSLNRISTTALEYEFSTYETVADAIAFTYRSDGHEFYQLTFPTANVTWVYDAATQMWHRRASMDSRGALNRHRANCSMRYLGKTIVGDYLNGQLYEYSEGAYTDAGSTIPRIRRAPHMWNDRKVVRYQDLCVEFEPGIGTQTGQGANPQAMLRWSDDGGSTWSNEHWRPIGKAGGYLTRARWTRLGSSRDRIFELSISDPVKVAIIGATVNVATGR